MPLPDAELDRPSAIVLGIVGAAAKGVLYPLITGAAVLVLAIVSAFRFRHGGRGHGR
ncbi:hypothetical protein [Kitasatospora herbaricolor]|uniref:hypothetical protein n=1 Tax=Kitasatospora herbaricolor TaxID=68217 RepID=UPI0036D95FE0